MRLQTQCSTLADDHSEPSRRLTRWRLRLAEYKFQINYKNRCYNALVYVLSRFISFVPTEQNDQYDILAFGRKHESDEQSNKNQ